MSKLHASRTLILIRHAHRDTTHRAADNGLSEKGVKQAASLLKQYLRAFSPRDARPSRAVVPRIYSSPKKRCVETVTPIAHELCARIEILDDLLEQRAEETLAGLRLRAARFVEKWRKDSNQGPVTIVCSHGDWLPAALEAATGARAQLKKGAWAEVVVDDRGHLRLEWLIQSFKFR